MKDPRITYVITVGKDVVPHDLRIRVQVPVEAQRQILKSASRDPLVIEIKTPVASGDPKAPCAPC